jgi:hypothetical protein
MCSRSPEVIIPVVFSTDLPRMTILNILRKSWCDSRRSREEFSSRDKSLPSSHPNRINRAQRFSRQESAVIKRHRAQPPALAFLKSCSSAAEEIICHGRCQMSILHTEKYSSVISFRIPHGVVAVRAILL